MDEIVLIRDVRNVQYEVVWDGSPKTSRQLCTPEYPRTVAEPEPSKRAVTIARRDFQDALHQFDHVEPLALQFDGEGA